MSPLRMGSATLAGVSAESLADRAAALARAIADGSRELEPKHVAAAADLVDKVRERTSIAGGHTVVGLAGATGSGKSSLFNAVVGEPVARIGARRPTTSTPAAAVWGGAPATELLDWLAVPERHHVTAKATDRGDQGAGDQTVGVLGSLDGLVLLDLPDFDSRVDSHRIEARRVLELVDVFVWVTDPQKYADALLHEDYLRVLATHDAVTLVVLNQIDRLAPDAVEQCREDLSRLLADDGLVTTRVMSTSARTGEGVTELTQALANAVAGASAARARLSADITAVARDLRAGVGDSEPTVAADADGALVDALSRAAGVPVVLKAVVQDYRHEAHQVGGWLFTRWLSSFKADPLSRLRLGKSVVSMTSIGEADVRAVLGRSAIPPPSPSARAAVSLATRQVADRAGSGLPVRWAEAVADAAAPGDRTLADALDQAVVHSPLRVRRPMWWSVVGALQWLFGLAVIAGVGWLTAIAVVSWLQLPELPTPTVGVLPWPFVLLAGGILLGLLTAGVSRGLARVGARRRAALVGRRLRDAIAEVARERIVAPVDAVLTRHRRVRELLDKALEV